MVMIRHCLFVFTLLRESILRKRSYDITAVELLGLCADHTVLCIIVRKGWLLLRKGSIISLKSCIIPRKGFEIPREELIKANKVKSWFLRHLRSPSDVAGLFADSVLHCLFSNREGLGTSQCKLWDKQLLIHIVRKSTPRLTKYQVWFYSGQFWLRYSDLKTSKLTKKCMASGRCL